MNCRFCKTELVDEFVDLANSPPSNSYLSFSELNEPEVYYPLRLFVCHKCFLVQIDEYKKANEIFSKEYAYFSSFSTSWLKHCKKYVEQMIERFAFGSESMVVEIASNDGYLLQYFKERNIPVLGIEPTENTAQAARQKGIETLVEFFGRDFAARLVKERGRADLLLGNNVLAHVPDINDFVQGMKVALNDNGVITMEFPHLIQLVKNIQFDTIYHEHFSYLSFTTVVNIFRSNGLKIFDVQEIPTHGGSLRIFACHEEDESKTILSSVQSLLQAETDSGVRSMEYYRDFQQNVDAVKIKLLKFLLDAKAEGKKVAAYGAAAKGNTLLNYCGVRHDLISFVVDASPHKQNKYMPGSHLPIYDESAIEVNRPDYVVILPWNLKEEIVNQLSYIRSWGGKFVTAIPSLEILP